MTETNPQAVPDVQALVPLPDVPQEVTNAAQASEVIARLGTLIDGLEVNSPQAAEWATEFGVRVARAKKLVEERKETEFRPHKEAADAVSKAYNPVITAVDAVLAKARTKLGTWLQAERVRVEAERRAALKAQEDEALAAAQALLDEGSMNADQVIELASKKAAEFHTAGKPDAAKVIMAQATAMATRLKLAAARKADDALVAPAAAPPPPAAPTLMRSAAGGSAGGRAVKDFSVQDLAKVPLQFLQLNEAAVRDALRNGTTEIPGLVITDRVGVTFRTR